MVFAEDGRQREQRTLRGVSAQTIAKGYNRKKDDVARRHLRWNGGGECGSEG